VLDCPAADGGEDVDDGGSGDDGGTGDDDGGGDDGGGGVAGEDEKFCSPGVLGLEVLSDKRAYRA
jgi:hypothetical protein